MLNGFIMSYKHFIMKITAEFDSDWFIQFL